MLGNEQRGLLMDSGQERAVKPRQAHRRIPCAIQEDKVVKELVESIF